MDELSRRERLLRTLDGEQIDRLATFDNIHNIELIEHLMGSSIITSGGRDTWHIVRSFARQGMSRIASREIST